MGRRAFSAALASLCCTAPPLCARPALADNAPPPARVADPLAALKAKIEADREADRIEEEKLRAAALTPNRYGRLQEEPEAAPLKMETRGFNGQRGVNALGRLAPEYEGDDRERYSNPYAQRLAEKSKTRPDLLKPGTPEVPVYRDGYLSVKPNNLKCDEDGMNCKFSGMMPGSLKRELEKPKYEVPFEQTADYRRAQFAEENRIKREANLAKAAAKRQEVAAANAD